MPSVAFILLSIVIRYANLDRCSDRPSKKGFLGFLAKPLKELGVNRNHPLYLVVPEEWRAPHFSWDTTTRATRWASDARYVSLISSGRPEDIRRAFHWHLFSWFLTNLASISYCDLNLDIDRLHDDEAYRASFSETVARLTGASPNLSKLSKFERYYRFSFFDIEESCLLVAATISAALGDGRLERAIKTLGREPLENSRRCRRPNLAQETRRISGFDSKQ